MMRPVVWFLAAVTLVLAPAGLASDQHDPGILVAMDRDRLRGELSASEGRVVLVNLWATWCTPCLREIPDLLTLETELPASDFRLLAISMDDAYSEGWLTQCGMKPCPPATYSIARVRS
jgi:thiol-disulfide isomerase/thioredoxin